MFCNVDNKSTIAREEIFGPVLSVIPADDEEDTLEIANDTVYGLNASVFTQDVERAYAAARQLRSGTVGHNAFRSDFTIAFGGLKQSGIGRASFSMQCQRPYKSWLTQNWPAQSLGARIDVGLYSKVGSTSLQSDDRQTHTRRAKSRARGQLAFGDYQ